MKKDELKEKANLAAEKAEELADDALDEVAGGIYAAGAHGAASTQGIGKGGRPIIGSQILGGNNDSLTQAVAGKSGVNTAGTAGLGPVAGVSGQPNADSTEGKPNTSSTAGLDTKGIW